MRGFISLLTAMAFCAAGQVANGQILFRRGEWDRVSCSIEGQLLDFTHNHGKDHRIWSQALGQKRDLYVYLPPNYDATKKYPLIIYLHGAFQDEHYFLRTVVKRYDRAIVEGRLPPAIVASPDGSILGRPSFKHIASFFANSDAGKYEDYVMDDVWCFLMDNFSIRPEREAHALVGVSMGGSAAFSHAIKHRDKVKIAVGFMPALNLRWVDCHDNYMAKFDPDCWGWRSKLRPLEVIGRPRGITVRMFALSHSLAGHGPEALVKISEFNPIEQMDRYCLKDGDLDLYVAYGGKDEFNIDAQVESFLYRAAERGVSVGVDYIPNGRHNEETAWAFFPGAVRWLSERLASDNLYPK